MQQSLKILTDVPDYADRVARLETLKNRLEALMSPTIIAAFNTHDVGKCSCLHGVGDARSHASRHVPIIRTSLSIDGSSGAIGRFIRHLGQSNARLFSRKRETAERHRGEQTEHVIRDLDSP